MYELLPYGNAEPLKPREKIEKLGASSLSTEELLALILGSGNRECDVFELSRHIADYLSNTTSVPSLSSLRKIHGLGRVKSTQVLACLELSSRYILSDKAIAVRSPEDLIGRLAFLKFEQQEHLVAVSLNAANKIINVKELTTGLVNQTPVHPREAFSEAVKDRAVSVIFAHNHPSGSTEPSDEDFAITRVLCAAGRVLQIPVLDHIIIGRSGFTSIRRGCPEIFD
ncbi:DNA repair protein RadC [Fibrobacter sp.]|uniref:RadC family protein n=1 Tax=Fibrobacter sp. TaxID=35828 RepID=UPI001B102662|nr:DNA repair protein RadC [Fibrobacter sp.]MBO7061390.1 DNA repair protein RadC [Fibrobacter sp.]MBO7104915.1 DNA repair protein RadC [Fibrobacter sp.]MBR3669403.1 DNA repair protein RadC [Fibrobacter sp.]